MLNIHRSAHSDLSLSSLDMRKYLWVMCHTINSLEEMTLSSLHFIRKATERAARVILCYQLQHVTIRLLPCDVPFYGNTVKLFQQLQHSSQCRCMKLHAV